MLTHMSRGKVLTCLYVAPFPFKISRLLVVDPIQRLSAEQALAHPFFRQYQKDVRRFSPRKTFRVSSHCVCVRLIRMKICCTLEHDVQGAVEPRSETRWDFSFRFDQNRILSFKMIYSYALFSIITAWCHLLVSSDSTWIAQVMLCV